MQATKNNYRNPYSYKLIYIFRINDEVHKGALKIGEATVNYAGSPQELTPSCKVLNDAAHARIKQYTNTAGVKYELLYTEVACYKNSEGKNKAFSDKRVHKVLTNSGIKQAKFASENSGKALAGVALLQNADALYADGKYVDAQKTYAEASKPLADTVLEGRALLGEASSILAIYSVFVVCVHRTYCKQQREDISLRL